MKIYIVKAPQGEYEDYYEPIVKVFADKGKAEDNDLYDLVSDFNIENERYDEDHFDIDTCDVVDYFKEQAEKEVKGE